MPPPLPVNPAAVLEVQLPGGAAPLRGTRGDLTHYRDALQGELDGLGANPKDAGRADVLRRYISAVDQVLSRTTSATP